MSYPKRAKGWRTLTIEQKEFRWCAKVGEKTNTVRLQGSSSSGQQVIVTLRGWHYLWDFVGNFDNLPNNPYAITAKFAAQVIKFALAHGWKPEERGPAIHLDYENNTCILSQTVGDSQHPFLIDTTSDKEAKFPVFTRIWPQMYLV